ncbi:hypothetical protein EVAR_87337_1 [Eumeta japonica]|uniref:Uncharacterized protein n=1 Tax=Eumeta variegata TaxID=151549 RepID=A0A4C1YWD9_EUMVA|nr:hypothetical protein EVAR_87337_1 [Eumeta japonica]
MCLFANPRPNPRRDNSFRSPADRSGCRSALRSQRAPRARPHRTTTEAILPPPSCAAALRSATETRVTTALVSPPPIAVQRSQHIRKVPLLRPPHPVPVPARRTDSRLESLPCGLRVHDSSITNLD